MDRKIFSPKPTASAHADAHANVHADADSGTDSRTNSCPDVHADADANADADARPDARPDTDARPCVFLDANTDDSTAIGNVSVEEESHRERKREAVHPRVR